MVALIVLSFLLYLPTLRHGFVHWDDDVYVVENAHVQEGLSWQSVRWALTATEASNWHPLTWLSHELDYQLFGLRPIGHHATSVFLHVLNTALLFYVLQSATAMTLRSWIVAALWALHPLAVESVSWVAERKNVLSMLLFLLGLLAYIRYVRRPSLGRYIVIAILFGLALAAKPMVITLPLVLIIADFWPLNRITDWSAQSSPEEPEKIPLARALAEKIPLFLLSAGSAIVTLFAQRLGGALESFDQYPLGVQLSNAAVAYVAYLKQLVWPVQFAALYPHPGASLSWVRVVLALAFLAAITWFPWKNRHSKPYLLAAWLWYLVTLIPMIGIVQVGLQARADRYTYLPIVGVIFGIVWLVSEVANELRIGSPLRWVIASVVFAALAIATWRQQDPWSDDYSLWTHTLAVTGDNYIAERNLGAELISRGEPDQALPHFQRAIRFNPRDGAAHIDIGATWLSHGQLDDAIRELELGSQLPADRKSKFSAYENLAVSFVKRGDARQARDNFRRARDTDPDSFQQLITAYQQRVQQSPSADSYFWLAVLQAQAGRRSEAQSSWLKALTLRPQYSSMQSFFDVLASS
jgi:tetratricopeptide (TPR) repeat protein